MTPALNEISPSAMLGARRQNLSWYALYASAASSSFR
jgi:hypothetical protein